MLGEGKTSPDSLPHSQQGTSHPRDLVVAKVRASSRQSLGTVAGAGCLAQSNKLAIFLALVSQRPDDAVSQERLSLSSLLTLVFHKSRSLNSEELNTLSLLFSDHLN